MIDVTRWLLGVDCGTTSPVQQQQQRTSGACDQQKQKHHQWLLDFVDTTGAQGSASNLGPTIPSLTTLLIRVLVTTFRPAYRQGLPTV